MRDKMRNAAKSTVVMAVLIATLSAGTAIAADLEKLQGENMTGTSNTAKASNAIRFDGNGRAYKVRTQPGAGDALYLNVRNAAVSTSRVCFRPRIDGVLKGTKQCLGASQTSYVLKGQSLNVPAGSRVGIDASEVDGPDALFLDYALVRSNASASEPKDTDLDGVPDSRDVQGHGGYDDALTHESMTELTEFIAWLRKTPGAKGYIGEFGWPQNLENSRADFGDEDKFNALGETWLKRADAAGLSVTVQEASERYANTSTGGYFASVYLACGNTACSGLPAGSKPLALTKEGHQARVLERHRTTANYFRGMNFSGGQRWDEGVHSAASPGVRGDNGDYHYPTTEAPATHDGMNSFEYLRSQGITHVRLGFRWERMQPVLGGPIDQEEMNKYLQAVHNAEAAGLKVIADLHNYGGYWKTNEGGCDAGGAYDPTPGNPGTGKLCLGSDQLGQDKFVDIWKKLAAEFRDEPAIVMYDLMNEPSGKKGTVGGASKWETMTKAVVVGIRNSGDNTTILVPSVEAGIEGTDEAHARPWITDQPNLVWGAHQYLDHYVGGSTGGGKYSRSYAQENATSASKGF